MAEPIQDGIFREIDEELRQEQFARLWKRYGRIFVTGACIIVATVAGYKAWENYDLSNRGKQGEHCRRPFITYIVFAIRGMLYGAPFTSLS